MIWKRAAFLGAPTSPSRVGCLIPYNLLQRNDGLTTNEHWDEKHFHSASM